MTQRRILFLAEGQLGDLLVLTPALRATKESFPSATIAVLAVERRILDSSKPDFNDLTPNDEQRRACVLSTNPHVDELYVLSRPSLRMLRGLARLRAELQIMNFLRRKQFDVVVSAFAEDRFTLWSFVSGARVRVADRQQALHRLLTHTIMTRRTDRGILEYYCDLVRALGATVRTKHTEYRVPVECSAWADETLKSVQPARKIVVVLPGASADYKAWPPERFATLIDQISRLDATVLLVYTKFDMAIVNALRQKLKTTVLEIDTAHDIGNLAALLQRCVLCISNDSGPRHVAIALDVPSLSLIRQHHGREWNVYEPSDTRVTLAGKDVCPVCPPNMCLDKTPDGERYATHCMRMIRVEDVIPQIERMLSRDHSERLKGDLRQNIGSLR